MRFSGLSLPPAETSQRWCISRARMFRQVGTDIETLPGLSFLPWVSLRRRSVKNVVPCREPDPCARCPKKDAEPTRQNLPPRQVVTEHQDATAAHAHQRAKHVRRQPLFPRQQSQHSVNSLDSASAGQMSKPYRHDHSPQISGDDTLRPAPARTVYRDPARERRCAGTPSHAYTAATKLEPCCRHRFRAFVGNFSKWASSFDFFLRYPTIRLDFAGRRPTIPPLLTRMRE